MQCLAETLGRNVPQRLCRTWPLILCHWLTIAVLHRCQCCRVLSSACVSSMCKADKQFVEQACDWLDSRCEHDLGFKPPCRAESHFSRWNVPSFPHYPSFQVTLLWHETSTINNNDDLFLFLRTDHKKLMAFGFCLIIKFCWTNRVCVSVGCFRSPNDRA